VRPKGELIRGADRAWMPAPDAYTGSLKKIVNPSMEAYPASRLAKLLASDQPAQVAGLLLASITSATSTGGGP
jgi:hypothetical protein